MEHLNIPLSKHTRTTPPFAKGGVVWLLVILMSLILFAGWRFESVWLMRSNIFSAAPDNTVMALQIELNKDTAPIILAALQGVPLISNRSITIDDILPFTNGQLAFFVTNTGKTSVAVRTSKKTIPFGILKANEIVVQEINNDIFLLSESLSSISGLKTSVHTPFMPIIGKVWLGKIEFPDINMSGKLTFKNKKLEIELQQGGNEVKNAAKIKNIGSLRLKGPFVNDVDLGLVNPASEIVSGLNNGSDIINDLINKTSSIWMEIDENNTSSILLEIPSNELNGDETSAILRTISALANPSLNKKILSDGSVLNELIVDPALSTIEEVSIGQDKALRVNAGVGKYVFSVLKDDKMLISNSESLIQDYLKPTQNEQIPDCNGNSGSLVPIALLRNSSPDWYDPVFAKIVNFSKNFDKISIESNMYSTKLYFCGLSGVDNL